MRLTKLASCLAFPLICALPTAAQTISGSIDFVDQDSILGWACYNGDAVTVLPVQVWALNTSTLQWTYLGLEYANRERGDVGASGICGTAPSAHYHGFEFTIYPESLIATQGTYQIHVWNGGVWLPGSGANTVSFATAGFPSSNTWRTDYNDPNQALVSMVSCIWPFKGANPASQNISPDPHFLGAGATILQNPSWESSPGVFSPGPVWCLRNDPSNSASWYWSQPNSSTNAGSWPMSNYWVISPNNELAYSKVQSGPPSQSQPANGGLYSLSTASNYFYLGINNAGTGYHPGDTPFLSFGAQMGRGVSGPIGWIQPTGLDTHLDFQVRQLAESAAPDYHDIAVYVELMWGGYKRWIGLSVRQPVRARFHWNWNALESFWFPGGEFNILNSAEVVGTCSLGKHAQLPMLSLATVGQDQQVSIPLRKLLECMEANPFVNNNPGLGNLEWSTSRPTNLPLAITGVQIAIEQAPGQATASMSTRFSKPTLSYH